MRWLDVDGVESYSERDFPSDAVYLIVRVPGTETWDVRRNGAYLCQCPDLDAAKDAAEAHKRGESVRFGLLSS